MKHLSNDHEDHLSQYENSHKLCNETRHSVDNLMESQWKLVQLHDQKTKTLADGLIERTSSMLDKIESKIIPKGTEGDRQRKKN